MARLESRYVCGTCGASSLRWEGQCRSCSGWNTLVETVVEARSAAARKSRAPVAAPAVTPLSEVAAADADQIRAWYPGSRSRSGRRARPGLASSSSAASPASASPRSCSRSAAALAAALPGARVLYASGEESAAQIRLRAARLGVVSDSAGANIDVLPETSVERIVAAAEARRSAAGDRRLDPDADRRRPRGPGRLCRPGPQQRGAAAGVRQGERRAGDPGRPRDQGRDARRPQDARAHRRRGADPRGRATSPGSDCSDRSKNRFGSTEEIGRLRDGRRWAGRGRRSRLRPSSSPSRSARRASPWPRRSRAAGRCWSRSRRSSRPQVHGSPRRTVSGLDGQRLALLIAVLGRRAGMNLVSHDVYASVVGGLSVDEPAIDLPLTVALASALRDKPLGQGHRACAARSA